MQKKTYEDLFAEVQELRAQLEEAQETLNAIRRGEVDGLVVSTPKGDQVYTITGAEKPYRALIEDMREGAVMLSDNNTILYCNNGFSCIVKQPLEKLIGTNIQDIVSPFHSAIFEELLSSGRKGEGSKAGEINFLTAAKTIVPTFMSVNSFLKDDLKTTFLVITDLTLHMEEDVKRYTANLEREVAERKKVEDALKSAQKLLTSVTDTSSDAIYVKDLQSRWLFANPALEHIAGKPVSELLGKTDAEIYSNPEIGRVILENDRKILESGYSETFEEFVDLPDGRHFFISVKSPRLNEKGEVIGLVGISHDITPRTKREEQLKASQKKYKDLIETTNDFVWEIDPEGRYTYCSPQMEKLWNINPKEMIGKTPFEQMPSGTKEKGLRFFQSIVTSKKSFSGLQVPSLDGQGNLIFIEISGVPFFNDKGELLGYRGITRDITERKKAEEALGESEMKFRSLSENSPDPIMRFDKDLRILYLNPKNLVATGKSLNECIGKTNEELGMPAELCKLWNDLFERARMSKSVQQVDFDINTPEGAKTFSLRVVPEFAKDGSLVSYMGTSRDITERKQMQKKLEEYTKNLEDLVEERTKKLKTSALYARGLIEANLDPLVTINIEGKITDVNKATEIVTGCSREELIGSDFSDYFTKPEEARRGYLQVFQGGYVRDYPLSIRGKSGKIVEVLYNATLFRNEEGEVEGVFAAARDMTEHNKTEESLLNERKRLYAVLETLPAMVCMLTQDHHVDFANRSFRERFGNSEGRYCYDYCFGNKEPCSFCESYTPIETGKPHHWEVNAPDGSVIDAYDFPFTDFDGSLKILEMDIDITERKRMEKQLKDAERLAAIGATAGMVGHDIRNPLQSIVGDIFLAKLDVSALPESEEKKSLSENLDSICVNVEYINKIVQDLQDFARPITPAAEETDLEGLCEAVLFKNDLPDNIEGASHVEEDARTLFTDPALLNRVLSNLINNSVQAMPKGGKLYVHAFKERNDTIITVEDTGCGIPKSIGSKMFTPMFTTKSKGQGFGLAVVKRVIEALGGTVTYESEVGKGSKFILRLPPPKK